MSRSPDAPVALVTGAAGGLGWALARQLQAAGYALVLADRDADALATRTAELAAPETVASLAGDIVDTAHQLKLIELAEMRFGGLDLLVNNAGITHRSLAARTDPAVLRQVMAVDWQAPLELALKALPALQRRPGGIINIGSMAGWMPVLGRTAYCAAKSALAQSFEVLRGELKASGIHILMAYPSFLETGIEKHALGHDGRPAAHARSTVGRSKDADWMARRIVNAYQRGARRVYSDRFTVLASLLWRLAPDLYQRQMTRRFASELEQGGA